MKSKKLSDLMFGKIPLKIKDRETILQIYEEFLQHHYIIVVNLINDYDKNTLVFFTDLLLHLNDKYRSELYKTAVYWEFYEIYFEKLDIHG